MSTKHNPARGKGLPRSLSKSIAGDRPYISRIHDTCNTTNASLACKLHRGAQSGTKVLFEVCHIFQSNRQAKQAVLHVRPN